MNQRFTCIHIGILLPRLVLLNRFMNNLNHIQIAITPQCYKEENTRFSNLYKGLEIHFPRSIQAITLILELFLFVGFLIQRNLFKYEFIIRLGE